MDARSACFSSGSNLVQRMLRFSTIASALLGAAPVAAGQDTLVPWFFNSDGVPVMQPHEYDEDTGSTVYVLAWDFQQPQNQPTPYADVLVFNGPLFDPPEGVAAATGTRRLLTSSIDGETETARRALQLHVNYSRVPVGSISGPRYAEPTFFIPGGNKAQTTPEPFDAGLGGTGLDGTLIAPTRAALGVVGTSVTPTKSRFPFWHELPILPESMANQFKNKMNAIYVTAGIGVPISELDGASYGVLQNATKDRLLVRVSGIWVDQSSKIQNANPPIQGQLLNARFGNSSGACFADFDGDGYLDLFVGKYGDGFVGARSRLLIYDEVNDKFDDLTATKLPNLSVATVDVAAGDIDRDGDQDIVLANRVKPGAGPHPEAIDYYLKNNWPSAFTAVPLGMSVESDTRSVALGNLDHVVGPEIVLGNAGGNTFSNTLDEESHPLQIFRTDTYPNVSFFDDVASFLLGQDETEISRPFTWQVVIADVFAPDGQPTFPSGADGKLDLFLVNHRDILLDHNPDPGGEARDASNVQILVNRNMPPSRWFQNGGRWDVHWARSLALADFSFNSDPLWGGCAPGTLDFFVGTGNSYSGADNRLMENLGPPAGILFNTAPNFAVHMSYDGMPGNERGYGFDFGDFDGDGKLDAIQTSRGYNFLASSCGFTIVGGHGAWHKVMANVMANGIPVPFSNARGQLFPRGAEDAVFADFDQDGVLDGLVASDISSSPTHPTAPQTFDTVVLRKPGAAVNFQHDTTTEELLPSGSGSMTIDAYIDVNGRVQANRPTIADRAVAVDLDNDGDEDGLVRLFGIGNPEGTAPGTPALGPGGPLPESIETYAAGFRYLENIIDPCEPEPCEPPPPWFSDVAPTKMHNSPNEGFSGNWNRPLGFEVLADFDNNGACDLFSLVHDDAKVGPDVTAIQQTYDLLFLNGKEGEQPVGHLVEHGDDWHLPRRPMPGGSGSFGASGVAQGDLDNDGDADLFVTCAADSTFSALLLNRVIDPQTPAERFEDVFVDRVPVDESEVSSAIHSPMEGTSVVDRGGMPIVVDIDGDGDLDIAYAVQRNIPRIYRNKGADTTGDGFIDASDTSKPGRFEDVTDEYFDVEHPRIRPMVDSFDAQAADIDRDGDYDLMFDCFDDEIVPLRNDVAQSGTKPTITEAWPRVGSIRGRKVRLEGVNLSSPEMIELRCRGTGITVPVLPPAITPEANGCISFTVPNVPGLKGLVQIRVLQSDTQGDQWTRQYFGYFIFEPTLP